MPGLIIEPNMAQPDDFYEALIKKFANFLQSIKEIEKVWSRRSVEDDTVIVAFIHAHLKLYQR